MKAGLGDVAFDTYFVLRFRGKQLNPSAIFVLHQPDLLLMWRTLKDFLLTSLLCEEIH